MSAPSLVARALTLHSFLQARWLTRRLRTRSEVEAWQSARLRQFLTHVAPHAPAFKSLARKPLHEWPLMDKAALMADFARYNRLGLTTSAAWRAFETSTPPAPGYAVGASTGTSGNRGLYVVSSRERYAWLGIMLAKAMPDIMTTRRRVAVVLPATSRLYDAANESGRLSLKFFDLTVGVDAQLAPIAAFAPTDIVAPPKMLRALAEADLPLAPRQVFSGAEVLDAADRAIIETRFGCVVREIYMATEGLFAIACPLGRLHLTEEYVFFEWEPASSDGPARQPIITDFTRRTQIMARYRMNDLLVLDDRACACGSPLQAVAEIMGRADDIFTLRRADGSNARFTPDVIRNAIIDADRSITDFRVIQTGPARVRLLLPPAQGACLSAAEAALAALFARAGAFPVIEHGVEFPKAEGARKLRRVSVDLAAMS